MTVGSGESAIFVGANGSGKSRLGVYIEAIAAVEFVQRIAAQKDLSISDTIDLISFDRANNKLRFGNADHGVAQTKLTYRWRQSPATHMLSDYEALLQTLFADHNRVAIEYLRLRQNDSQIEPPFSRLNKLIEIWRELLPHRALEISDGALKVRSPAISTVYAGSQMSDGERAIFYFLGQSLMAPVDGLIIVDEPENHIHRAILGALWDAAEQARNDCAFVYITHDLDFAATRPAVSKYYLRSYIFGTPGKWDVDVIPTDTGLPETTVVELVGSRKPILFIEGDLGSLDLTWYRAIYKAWTITPIGSCEAVIQSVASFRQRSGLHWITVRGLIDADHRTSEEIAFLEGRNIYVLPVAEVENLILLPSVFSVLAEALSCASAATALIELTADVMTEASSNIDQISARYTARALDKKLKKIKVDAKDLPTLEASFRAELGGIDPAVIFGQFKLLLESKIQASDLTAVLQLYDNKGLLARAAARLGIGGPRQLSEKVGRLLGSDNGQRLRVALASELPSIS